MAGDPPGGAPGPAGAVRYLGGRADLWQKEFPPSFADASATFDAARFVVLGLPYDATVSFRHGTALGPAAIRQASWNLETLNVRNRVDAAKVPVHDAGDLALAGLAPDAMFDAVRAGVRRLARAGKFPVLLGGEHSTIPGAVHAMREVHPDLGVLQIDAHLDWRSEYEGTPHNHACAARRIADAVGADKIVSLGIRSVEAAELAAAERDGLLFFTSYDVAADGMGVCLQRALDRLGDGPVWLTLDIDGLDPAFAPATGTPETFGLTPFDVLRAITRAADRLVGFDVNEVAPAWDAGNTAAVAAKICREVMTEVWSRRWGSARSS